MQTDGLDSLLNRCVVLDTNGSMIYIGTLIRHDTNGYWLADADVHDRSEGHSTKEMYINEAHERERSRLRRVSRRRVFVERHAAVSLSALDDVVTEDAAVDEEP